MKKILIIGILAYLVVTQVLNVNDVANPVYIPPILKEGKEDQRSYEMNSQIRKLVDSINDENFKIRTLSYENFKIDIKDMVFSARANLSYEKENNFRMTSSSIAGKELDIGMNKEYFWFWSRRTNPQKLYYAKNEEASKTRLRSPFNPVWLKSCTGINEIDKKDVQTGREGDFVYVRKIIQTSEGIVKKTILIDPRIKKVIGNYLHKMNGEIIVSNEILKFKEANGFLIPSKIKTIWHEENFVMEWSIKKIEVNSEINKNNFSMPKNIEKINMAEM